jgi:hypothetical protein
MTEIDRIRNEIEKFLREMMLENYLHYSGQKETLEIQAIYRKFGYLFTKDLALELRDLMEKTTPLETENIKNLFTFILFGWIGEKLKAEFEELANKQATLKIKLKGEEIPYRSVAVKIANTENENERKEWYHALVDEDRKFTEEYHKPRWLKTWEMVESMGYGSYLTSMSKFHEVDYPALSETMNRFISETEDLYIEIFNAFTMDKISKPLKKCGYWDISYLNRGKELDRFFPAEKMMPMMREFFSDLGFPLDDIKAIIPDIESRPKKVPRAFCSAVIVGEEVYINLQPIGGHKDYTTMLHEAGHAYHHAFIDINLPVDVKRLGDRAISEGFAFLFNYLPENPEWCRRYLGIDDPSEIMFNELRQKLFFLRRYGAKLAYEIELHRDNTFKGKDLIYKDKLQSALKFETPADNYLTDLDPGFYVADYLRAWIWEVQLRNYLEGKYGIKWFMDKEAGKELAGMWQMGKKYPVEKLATMIGQDGLDIEPVRNRIMDGLKKGKK